MALHDVRSDLVFDQLHARELSDSADHFTSAMISGLTVYPDFSGAESSRIESIRLERAGHCEELIRATNDPRLVAKVQLSMLQRIALRPLL
jgi:hypothetical protein